MKPEKKKTTWQKVRKFFNDLHLWMGLGSGLVVLAICFSGTVYVFNTELRELSAPHLYSLEQTPEGPMLSAEQIISAVEKSTGGKALFVKIPVDKDRTWQVSVKKEEKEKSREGEKKSEGQGQARDEKKKDGERKQGDNARGSKGGNEKEKGGGGGGRPN